MTQVYGARMLARSAKFGRNREVGFTRMSNKLIEGAMAGELLRILIAKPGMNQADAQAEAVRVVARTLPHGRMVRSVVPKRSRNDSAAYRKQVA
ncbi:hypothetical protein [Sphingomonas sp. TREG-RG-20F-R18-01]|uniref:hypothetical protein n=1 Tax=Sphingomonas sp. TREG-RG-20F-R18-01 TaxID=2914982 RepID=UPI001F5AE198|nr:hypothetical protein [Sphingomonas sp. TREG-RG-20F-R18-01]